MNQAEVRKSIENILSQSYTGTMATVKNNKPYSRYMTFLNEELMLYTITNKETDKAEEVANNPHTHILLGYEGEGFGDSYVEYEGTVTIKDDEAWKKKLWHDSMKAWFDGPEDPSLIVLEITPTDIHLMNKQGQPPITLEL